jgi:hypothetical protein
MFARRKGTGRIKAGPSIRGDKELMTAYNPAAAPEPQLMPWHTVGPFNTNIFATSMSYFRLDDSF